MVTELQKLYNATRPTKHTESATLLAMWRLTGIDPGTLSRELARARRNDAIDAKRAKRDARMQVAA